MASVMWLQDLARAESTTVGGKAAGLGALHAAGFAVPDGFAIPADVAAALVGPPEVWPVQTRESLLEALCELAAEGQSVAVRSSAVGEDSVGASFAGQHATVLDVTHADFLDAIHTCLASLTSPAALAYRSHAAGVDAGAMAVLVQRMVRADAGGVAFSIDPVSGDPGRAVVEAVAGSGESLVSGKAEAHRYVFSRPSLEVAEEHRPSEVAIGEGQAREAAAAAVRAEGALGSPQDIEFAFEGKKLWLLQSRPITTLPGKDRPAAGWVSEFDTPTSPGDLWTSANVQEVLPSILTPLTMSAFNEYVHRAYTEGYQRLKVLDRDEWPIFIGLFYSRAYLNVGATRLIAERVIGADPGGVEHRFLGGEAGAPASKPATRRVWKYRLRTIIPMLRMSLGIHRAAARIERETMAMQRRVRSERPEALSGADLAARRKELSEFVAHTFQVHLQASGCAGFGFEQVAKLVRPVLGDATEGAIPALFSGMRGVESAQIGLDLWGLSRIAIREGLVRQLARPDFDPTAVELPEPCRHSFAAFLERHGHRGLNEMEPASPTWRQDPAPVLAIIRAYADLPDDQSPEATLRRQEDARLRLTDDLAGRMNFLKRRFFLVQLKQAQGWVALREHTKSVIVRGTRLADHYLPEAAQRLAGAGHIERPEDIFFLTATELDDALAGKPVADLRAAVARRRREMERNRHAVLPERFHGHPVPIEPDLSHHTGDVLTGTPVSPGLVTGRARVIHDPAVDEPIQPGEILVAPVTDAGWTPLFALATGLVVDMGSALSHGSTVAREFGLPAVVNVRRGTRSIRTGDLIQVNGSKGTVTILESLVLSPQS